MRNFVMQSFVFILVLACAGALANAQSLSQADRDKAFSYLESTRQGVIDATKGLSPAQWNFKAGPDRWSCTRLLPDTHCRLSRRLDR